MSKSISNKYSICGYKLCEHEFINISTKHFYADTRVFHRFQRLFNEYSSNPIYISSFKNIETSLAETIFLSKPPLIHLLYFLIKNFKSLNQRVLLIHDPEILLIVPLLKMFNYKKIIFDAHEDVEEDILIKEYIPLYLRKFISNMFSAYLKFLIYLKLETISPSENFVKKYNGLKIFNYPYELYGADNKKIVYGRNKKYLYFGSLTETRSLSLIIDVFNKRSEKLTLIGPINDSFLQDKIEASNSNITYKGHISLSDAPDALRDFDVGLCIPKLSKIAHDALPVKILEYYNFNKIIISSKFDAALKLNINNIYFTELNHSDFNNCIDKVNKIPEATFLTSNKSRHSFRQQFLCVD